MYGQTEASPRMSYLEISKLLNKYESIGKPISGGQFWIENKKGNKINKNNEIGELIYSGDNVFMGYSNSYHDLNKKDEVHGVLKTGDLVKKDNEGFYFIVGRKKRFIKLYGDRVSLDYLENKLQSKNYNAACTGSDDKLVIFCEKKKTKKINKSKIAEVVNIIASRFKLIEIENLPKNQNKKISYIHLNKLINNE
jgi:acyl-CoA synthetase (AMP-forming)/AMP-acid ligase II|tara:strand:- start:403 stop:987 length:585 start_codon:yes stop_codon:yes gene_type:complete